MQACVNSKRMRPILNGSAPPTWLHPTLSECVGLARTVNIHRIWPYIWWFPCQKYRIYMVLANPKRMCPTLNGCAPPTSLHLTWITESLQLKMYTVCEDCTPSSWRPRTPTWKQCAGRGHGVYNLNHTIRNHTIPYHSKREKQMKRKHWLPEGSAQEEGAVSVPKIIPYPKTIPYHTIPYHTIPYHTIPYHTIPYHTIPYQKPKGNNKSNAGSELIGTMPYHTNRKS